MENPFKIEKVIPPKNRFDQKLLGFLVDSLKGLKICSDECVYIPKEVLPREKTYEYVSKASSLLRHQVGPLKFTIKTVKNDNKEVLGVRVFRKS